MSKREYKRFISNPGSPIKKLFSPVVLPDGSFELRESGEQNIDDMIQAQVPSTDISVILARVGNGDVSALNQTKGMYGDFTQMPKTFAEVLQLQIDAKNIYNKLTDEQKKEFDYSFDKFFASAGSDEWIEKIQGKKAAVDVEHEEKESVVTE